MPEKPEKAKVEEEDAFSTKGKERELGDCDLRDKLGKYLPPSEFERKTASCVTRDGEVEAERLLFENAIELGEVRVVEVTDA